jgi:hypothetical protein
MESATGVNLLEARFAMYEPVVKKKKKKKKKKMSRQREEKTHVRTKLFDFFFLFSLPIVVRESAPITTPPLNVTAKIEV